jgi:hypothetical protein
VDSCANLTACCSQLLLNSPSHGQECSTLIGYRPHQLVVQAINTCNIDLRHVKNKGCVGVYSGLLTHLGVTILCDSQRVAR